MKPYDIRKELRKMIDALQQERVSIDKQIQFAEKGLADFDDKSNNLNNNLNTTATTTGNLPIMNTFKFSENETPEKKTARKPYARHPKSVRSYVQAYIEHVFSENGSRGITPELDYKKVCKHAGITIKKSTVTSRLYEELKTLSDTGVLKRAKVKNGNSSRKLMSYKLI